MRVKRAVGVPVATVLFRPALMRAAERYMRIYYRWDTARRWQLSDRPPEWFDHRADLYRFAELRRPYWAERGVYARELMHAGCRVLDLCCGDGFFPFHFYAETATHIDAVDRDVSALAHANRYHRHPSITYRRQDIVADAFPGDGYDVVVWDGAIEHFPLDQIHVVLDKIRAVLADGGVLCGYTVLNVGERMHPDHLHEFPDADALAATLREHSANVVTLETRYPDRHNIYFRAADGPIPGWG